MPRNNEYPKGVRIIEVADEELRQPQKALARPSLSSQVQPRHTLPYIAAPHQISALSPFHVWPTGEIQPARSLCIAWAPEALASQQYRLLKYKLKQGIDPHIIGITSPQPREGKSTVAANLSLALAEGRRTRVLLLDLNLRRPSLIAMFGLLTGGCLAEQLRRKHRDPSAKWDVLGLGPSLHLMAGADPMDNPSALLKSEEVARLLSDLMEHYEYIVVDLPAVLQAADVKIIQEQIDGIVMVCRAGVSTKAAINTSIAQLGQAKIQGMVLMDIQTRYLHR